MTSVPTLGYWDAKGRAEPIRVLLHYSGVKFNDKRYVKERREEWLSDKTTLGLDFPNLPYYIDGDIKLTQTLAIMKYLGRKHGLVATDLKASGIQDMVEQELIDVFQGLMYFIHNLGNDREEKKGEFVKEKLEPQLQSLVKFLGKNQWFGQKFSYLDILANSLVQKLVEVFTPEVLAKYPTLNEFQKRFENVPAIKKYLESSK